MMTHQMKTINEQPNSIKSVCNGLIAGYSAATCGIVVGHPLDSIKVLLQTNGGIGCNRQTTSGSTNTSTSMSNGGSADTAMTRAASKASANSSYSGASSATHSTSSKAHVSTAALETNTRRIHSNLLSGMRSIRSLYAGVTGPLLASGAVRSVNFAIYDSMRRALYHRQIQSELPHSTLRNGRKDDYLYYDRLSNVAIASFVSGGATTIATSPMAMVKTKQQIMLWSFRKAVVETFYKGMNENSHLLRGVRNFYTGFGVHFYCDAVGTAIYFSSYEYLKRQVAQRKLSDINYPNNIIATLDISLHERMACAALSGMVCWTVIFPWDVIRSRLYLQAITNESSLNGFTLARRMIQEQGFMSLYRGMGITVVRAGPVAAAVLPVYDYVLTVLNNLS